MKIVYISNSIFPSRKASSIQVMKMCQAFVKNGHQVILLVPKKKEKEEKGINNTYDFYNVEACFEVFKLSCPNKYIYGFLAAFKAKELGADLVYSRLLSACYYSVNNELPSIFEAHHHKVNPNLFYDLINNDNMRRIVVISEALSCYYRKKYKLSDDYIIVAHDGADISENTGSYYLRESNKMQVGYIGHLYPGKGMEIITQLALRYKRADFHIIGGEDSDIKYWENEAKNINNIIFHGFMPYDKASKYRQAFDVLLAPYQKEVLIGNNLNIASWMSPLKIFEYMSSEKAIIASDLPVIREILSDYNTALLCDPEDINSWLDALNVLDKNERLRMNIGINAKKEFEDKYTWEARSKKVITNLPKKRNNKISLYYNNILEKRLKGKKYIIFGTGSSAQNTYYLLEALGLNINIQYFVDNDNSKWSEEFKGFIIKSPQVLLKECENEIFIIVASSYYDEILKQLEEYGFEKEINFTSYINLYKCLSLMRKLKLED